MSLSPFFIERPIFAWVIAIVIMLAGGIAAFRPAGRAVSNDRAARRLGPRRTYPGADAATVRNSVTQVIEQQLTGLDNLLYFSSSSSSDGSVTIIATFAGQAPMPTLRRCRFQNKVQQAAAQLPSQVQQLTGVTVAKAQTNFLLVVAMHDDTSGRYTTLVVSGLHDLQDAGFAQPRHRRRQHPEFRLRNRDAGLASITFRTLLPAVRPASAAAPSRHRMSRSRWP